jgi:hypothetical protein
MLIDNTEKIIKNIDKTAAKEVAQIEAQVALDIAEQKKTWTVKEKAELAKIKLYETDQKERFIQHHASKVSIETQKRELAAKNIIYQDVLAQVKSSIKKDATFFIEACLKQLPNKYEELHIPTWATYKGAKNTLDEDDFKVIVKVSDTQEFEYSLETMLEEHNNDILNILFKKK